MPESLFIVGGEVEPPYFVGRRNEIEKMKMDIRTLAQNNVIIGPRRIGKTSLLKNLKLSVQGEFLFVTVNCREMTGFSDFFRAVTQALLAAYEEKHHVKGLAQRYSQIFRGKITAAYKSLSEVGGSIEHVGNIYLRFREKDVDEEELVFETFDFIRKFSGEKKEPIIIAFDEFQELKRFNGRIFNTLKSQMDSQPSVRYIFSGSSVSLLHEVFLKPDSPLYLMAARIQLEPIEEEHVRKYIRDRLLTRNIEITERALKKIYEYTGGFPFYFQKIGFILYQNSVLKNKNIIDEEDVKSAFNSMLGEFDSEFEARYEWKFSHQQKIILKFLSKEEYRRLSEISSDMQTPASSLTTSMKDLYNTMTIAKPEEGLYGILDNVFRIWIQRNILRTFGE
ncbi:MAG TPA: ATP-binding protein [Methanosarcina sp.]|nr:ATP-binding protein [Methanosarcina sp.]